ncbi:ATP-grasp domain-containing protein [Krasilnikovia sp. MM14-A1004]|uniref:ATP-grasp domain-containing protein n=1 Tax=Krasilnikovia sp. MM14-A1004 TaxID=3373541 RepID=UPI00399C60C8
MTSPPPVRDVLVVGRRRLELVNRMVQDPDLRLSLITEPDCLPLYPPVAAVELVDNVQNLDEVRNAALRLMNRRPFDAVVAPAESSIPTGGYLRTYLGLPGIPFDVAHAFCNKNAMKARLRRAGIPVADSRLVPLADSVERVLRAQGLPAVIKPVWGDGSANVHVVRDEAELAELTRPDGPLLGSSAYNEPPFLVEEYLEFEDEYHCDGLVRDGEVQFAAVSKYIVPSLRSMGSVFGSYTLPADDDAARAVAELHREVVRAMGLADSVTHLEVFRTRRGFVVGEIACRPGGSGIPRNLLRAYGFDTWEHFLATELNNPLQWRPDVADGSFAWVMFPLHRGVVSRVPDAGVFADLAEVEEVDIKVKPGERIAGTLYSSSMSAVVHCRTDLPGDVPDLVTALQERFTVEYETPVPVS